MSVLIHDRYECRFNTISAAPPWQRVCLRPEFWGQDTALIVDALCLKHLNGSVARSPPFELTQNLFQVAAETATPANAMIRGVKIINRPPIPRPVATRPLLWFESPMLLPQRLSEAKVEIPRLSLGHVPVCTLQRGERH